MKNPFSRTKEPFVLKRKNITTGAWRDFEKYDEKIEFEDIKDDLEDGNYKLVRYRGKGKGYETFWTKKKGDPEDAGSSLASVFKHLENLKSKEAEIKRAYQLLNPMSVNFQISSIDDYAKAQEAGIIAKPEKLIGGKSVEEWLFEFLTNKDKSGKAGSKDEEDEEDELTIFSKKEEKVVLKALKKNPKMLKQFVKLTKAAAK